MHRTSIPCLLAALACPPVAACSSSGDSSDVAYVRIQNDFNDPQFSYNPPWTICRSSYLGEQFGAIAIGSTSAEQQVKPGLDNVLMVAAWDDPTCAAAHSMPIASANEEEVVSGQHRTITISMPAHQGPCPPEGVAPMPETLYDRIVALWPEYGFLPYAQRTQNPQCLPSQDTEADAGTDGPVDTGASLDAGAPGEGGAADSTSEASAHVDASDAGSD